MQIAERRAGAELMLEVEGQGGAAAPIRVAFCLGSLNVGGTELNAVRTAERLDRSRVELRVVSLQQDGPLLPRLEAAGIEVHRLPIPNLYAPAAWNQGRLLRELLRRHRVQVLHAHDKYANIFGIPWARAAGVGTLASRRWWAGEPRRGHRLLNRVSYRLSDAVLANSERVAEMLVRRESVPAERIVVVRNFLDAEAFDPLPEPESRLLREELGIPHDAKLVGSIANLRPVKDQATLLRAVAAVAAEFPSLHLVLVGDGESRAALRELGRQLGIEDRVHLAGRRPNLPNLHGLFDVSVLSSVSEGLSNSILEAMAAGRPVVATDVGGTADAVADGETGLLVPRCDPSAMAEGLRRLLADPAGARMMGEAGRSRARRRYAERSALCRLERVYGALAVPDGRRQRVAVLSHEFASDEE